MGNRTNKPYLGLAFLGFIFISCSHSPSSKEFEVTKYDDAPKIVKSPQSRHELPQGLQYGKIVPPIFPDSMKVERNLLCQIASYNSALIHGDVNSCEKYMYPDAFDYCKKYYPDFPDAEVMKEFFKDVSGDLSNALKEWAKNGVDFQIIVYNLERKIKYKDDIIIVFNVTSNMCSDNVYIYSAELDKTIGISQNGGTNFWFMNNHDDSPTILGIHYPQNVVNAIMDY